MANVSMNTEIIHRNKSAKERTCCCVRVLFYVISFFFFFILYSYCNNNSLLFATYFKKRLYFPVSNERNQDRHDRMRKRKRKSAEDRESQPNRIEWKRTEWEWIHSQRVRVQCINGQIILVVTMLTIPIYKIYNLNGHCIANGDSLNSAGCSFVPWMVKVERVPSHGKYYVILCSVIGIYVAADIVLHKESSIVRNPAIYSRPHHIYSWEFFCCCSICYQICSLSLICTHLTITKRKSKRDEHNGAERLAGMHCTFSLFLLILEW